MVRLTPLPKNERLKVKRILYVDEIIKLGIPMKYWTEFERKLRLFFKCFIECELCGCNLGSDALEYWISWRRENYVKKIVKIGKAASCGNSLRNALLDLFEETIEPELCEAEERDEQLQEMHMEMERWAEHFRNEHLKEIGRNAPRGPEPEPDPLAVAVKPVLFRLATFSLV